MPQQPLQPVAESSTQASLREFYQGLFARARAGEVYLVPQGVPITSSVLELSGGLPIIEIPPWAWDLMEMSPDVESDFHYAGTAPAPAEAVPTPTIPITPVQPVAEFPLQMTSDIPEPPPIPEDAAPEPVGPQVAQAPTTASSQAATIPTAPDEIVAVPTMADAVAANVAAAGTAAPPMNFYVAPQTPAAPAEDSTGAAITAAGEAFLAAPPTADEELASQAVASAQTRADEADAAAAAAAAEAAAEAEETREEAEELSALDAMLDRFEQVRDTMSYDDFLFHYNKNHSTTFTREDLPSISRGSREDLLDRWELLSKQGYTVSEFLHHFNKNRGTSFTATDLGKSSSPAKKTATTKTEAGLKAVALRYKTEKNRKNAKGFKVYTSPAHFLFHYNKNHGTNYTTKQLSDALKKYG